MYKGYNGKILHVDLTDNKITIEELDEMFYRKYFGGSCLGVYYALKNIPKGIDPLGPENVITFSIGPIANTKVSGTARHSVVAKSPQTKGIGASEAGGYWAPELAKAGFDAIVISGKSERPVYLWVKDGEAEIRDASYLWGKTTKDVQSLIREEHKDKNIKVAQTGVAGENLVKYACIVNELAHFNGRNGLGAVMGSKNLKAIAVRGTKATEFENPDKIKELAKIGAKKTMTEGAYIGFKELGTNVNVSKHIETGGVPTRNWTSGYFEGAEELTAEEWVNSYIQPGTCFACAQSCKRHVKKDVKIVDPSYGGPEYETVGMCGSNLGIASKEDIMKINEICSMYTMDTISFGGTLGFAMECFEEGLLTTEDTGGLELNFGNGEAAIELAKQTATLTGFGKVIAEGTAGLLEYVGEEGKKYAVHVGGKEFPAHMPHIKASLGLAYAAVPFFSDHVSSNSDDSIADDIAEPLKSFGLTKPVPDWGLLNDEKVRLYYLTQKGYSFIDSAAVCCLTFGYWTIYDFNDLVDLINWATGMNTNLYEMITMAERRIVMMYEFNAREGITKEDYTLPKKLFKTPLKGGVTDGVAVNEEDFMKAKELYFQIAGIDKDGRPTKAKKIELGLEWLN